MADKRIVVVGAGAIGGYTGGNLAHNGFDVTLVDPWPEHIEAIRQDKPYTEAERSAYAALVGIMGRIAIDSGKEITRDEALNSKLELAPGLEKLTIDSPAPVMPDIQGRYPVAMPGITVSV